MALGTRLGTVFGSRLGTKFPADGGAAPPPAFSGVLDDIVAAGDTVNVALSVSHQLDADYSGPLIRVRESGGNTEADIGADASTHKLDLVALAAHCGANNGFIVTVYDQSGNARDYTNATTAEQPKIYDSATGVVLVGDLPVAQLAGGAGGSGNGDGWARGDAAGYSGTQGLAVYVFVSFTDVSSYSRAAFTFGPGAGTTVCLRHSVTDTQLAANAQAGSSDAGAVVFTPVTAVGTLSDYILESASGGAVMNMTCEQRGTAMTPTGGSGTANIGTTAAAWGSNQNQAIGVTGFTSTLIGLNDVASAGAKTALRAFGAEECATAGV